MINHVVYFDLKTGFVNRVSLSNGTLMLNKVNKRLHKILRATLLFRIIDSPAYFFFRKNPTVYFIFLNVYFPLLIKAA